MTFEVVVRGQQRPMLVSMRKTAWVWMVMMVTACGGTVTFVGDEEADDGAPGEMAPPEDTPPSAPPVEQEADFPSVVHAIHQHDGAQWETIELSDAPASCAAMEDGVAFASATSLVLIFERPHPGGEPLLLPPGTHALGGPVAREARFATTNDVCDRDLRFAKTGTVTVETVSPDAVSGRYEIVLDDTGEVLEGAFTTEPPCEVADYGMVESCLEAP